jgi:hypothetical protein
MKGMGRVVFLAHLDEIKAEIDAGWPIKAAFLKRADRLAMSYAQFARYVDTIIRGNAHGPSDPLGPPARPGQGSADAAQSGPSESQPFRHSPVARDGEIDDLLGPNFLKRR